MTSVALVQGASRGIGLSLVKQLISRSDLHVVLSSRNPLAHILAIQTALGSSYDESRLTLLYVHLSLSLPLTIDCGVEISM